MSFKFFLILALSMNFLGFDSYARSYKYPKQKKRGLASKPIPPKIEIEKKDRKLPKPEYPRKKYDRPHDLDLMP